MHTIQLTHDMEAMFRSVARKTGQSLDQLVHEALDRFLEEWEDQQDSEEVQRLYLEFKESGEQGIPWEQVKTKMDTKHGL